jgi:hypothetical protein
MTKLVSRNRARAPAHDRFAAQILDYDYEHKDEIARRRYLPTPARIGYRREALAKFSLLALSISLLVRFARLLLGTRA